MYRSPLARCLLALAVAANCLSSASAQLAPPTPPPAPPLVVAPPNAGPVAVKNVKAPTDGLTIQIESFLDRADTPEAVRRFPCKIHAVKLDKETSYQIDLVGHNNLDTFLRLLDENHKVLAEDDDSGGNLNARIRHKTKKGGIYFIVATTFAGGEGDYTLSVRKVDVVVRKAAAMNAVEAKKPSEVKDQLTANDQADEARSVPCHVHSIALKANKTYIIDLESTDFDAYLRLESPTAEKIAEDDDGGGNLNSRIEYRVPADGNYRLVAMPLAALNGNGGAYTLRVTEKE
jgi:hypothetical protein